jgi:hypothetical protein
MSINALTLTKREGLEGPWIDCHHSNRASQVNVVLRRALYDATAWLHLQLMWNWL